MRNYGDINFFDYGVLSENEYDENCRNVAAEICYHTGSRVTIIKDTIEEAIKYFTDYLEEGDSITIISK